MTLCREILAKISGNQLLKKRHIRAVSTLWHKAMWIVQLRCLRILSRQMWLAAVIIIGLARNMHKILIKLLWIGFSI